MAEATNLLIMVIEASSKGRSSPPSSNETFQCESKLVIKLDIAMPLYFLFCGEMSHHVSQAQPPTDE